LTGTDQTDQKVDEAAVVVALEEGVAVAEVVKVDAAVVKVDEAAAEVALENGTMTDTVAATKLV